MDRPRKIFILDDEEDWRKILSGVFTEPEFQIDTAGTIVEARELLTKNFYHVGVFDVSMVSGDASNTDGIQLLAQMTEQWHRGGMEVVMISAYADKNRLRRAFTQFRVADFHDKFEFDPIEFLGGVQMLIANIVNLDLEVQWEESTHRSQAVRNLIAEPTANQRRPLHSSAEDELDDLLCRLFQKARSLLVRFIEPGSLGPSTLQVTPFYESGAGQPVLVKIGGLLEIGQEYENFKTHAQPFMGERTTDVINVRATAHLGGIAYSLLGTTGEGLKTFSSFYANASITELTETLRRLLFETCGVWYANPGLLQPRNLTKEYRQMFGLTEQNIGSVASQLKGVQSKEQLHFDSLNGRAFTNPIPIASARNFLTPSYVCITHGDFNGNNILVDGSNNAWLINFASTGPGHILRDIAKLDSDIRFHLLGADEANLAERLKMEEALCATKRFSDVEHLPEAFHTDNPGLAKAHAAAVSLRSSAYRLVTKNPNADLHEYYIALFYCAMNAARLLSLNDLQRQHALLSASLLADRLRGI